MMCSRRFVLTSLTAAALAAAVPAAAFAGGGEGKLRANLTATVAAPGATGRADFRPARKGKAAELKVEAQSLRVPAGTSLDVVWAPASGPPVKLGTLRVGAGGSGKLESAPQSRIAAGDAIRLTRPAATPTGTPAVLLQGTFRPHD